MTNFLNLNNQVLINLSAISHVELNATGDTVRVWFRGESEGQSHARPFRDLRGPEAEALRYWGRNTMAMAFPDRIQTPANYTQLREASATMAGAGGTGS